MHKYFFIFFSEKIRLDISCESSARQRIHIKNQALFSLKDKSKKIKMSSAAIFEFLFGTLKVKYPLTLYIQSKQYGPKILPDKTELMDISKSELEDRIYCEFIDISIWMGLR